MDTDSVGSGVYRPDLDEPEYCNAHNSHVLYELHLLMVCVRFPSIFCVEILFALVAAVAGNMNHSSIFLWLYRYAADHLRVHQHCLIALNYNSMSILAC